MLHAIAFAPDDALGGDFLDDARGVAPRAAFTHQRLLAQGADGGAAAADGREGASVVGLDFDASVAWPAYDWMGVVEGALEAVARYLARDLGPRGVRVNLVSAGPLETPAAGGIPGFDRLAGEWAGRAPLGWDAEDPSRSPHAAASCSPTGRRRISGEILHVDGGFHAMAAAQA